MSCDKRLLKSIRIQLELSNEGYQQKTRLIELN